MYTDAEVHFRYHLHCFMLVLFPCRTKIAVQKTLLCCLKSLFAHVVMHCVYLFILLFETMFHTQKMEIIFLIYLQYNGCYLFYSPCL